MPRWSLVCGHLSFGERSLVWVAGGETLSSPRRYNWGENRGIPYTRTGLRGGIPILTLQQEAGLAIRRTGQSIRMPCSIITGATQLSRRTGPGTIRPTSIV